MAPSHQTEIERLNAEIASKNQLIQEQVELINVQNNALEELPGLRAEQKVLKTALTTARQELARIHNTCFWSIIQRCIRIKNWFRKTLKI